MDVAKLDDNGKCPSCG